MNKYYICGMCNNPKVDFEKFSGPLKHKKDFEKLFKISKDPWMHKKLNRWEIKSINEIKKIIKENTGMEKFNVLDIGVGNGLKDKKIIQEFSSGGNFYFIDISKNALKEARKNIGFGKFITWDANKKPPFQNHFFDIILCNETIYYLNLGPFLKNIYYILKSTGIAVFEINLRDENYNYDLSKFYKYLKKNNLKKKKIINIICPKCKRKKGIYVISKT